MNENKNKATYFFNKKTTVHIEIASLRFYNGIIMEVHEDFIILLDRKMGEIPVYFSEIKTIEPYKPLENE